MESFRQQLHSILNGQPLLLLRAAYQHNFDSSLFGGGHFLLKAACAACFFGNHPGCAGAAEHGQIQLFGEGTLHTDQVRAGEACLGTLDNDLRSRQDAGVDAVPVVRQSSKFG